jgi:hypothetical protein
VTEIPTADEQAGKRWWWALRRAYGIPDIVTSENALHHLALQIVGDTDTSVVGVDEEANVGTLMVAAILDLAEDGRLDGALLNPAFDIARICEMEALKWVDHPELQRIMVERNALAIDDVCSYIQHNPGATAQVRLNFGSI